VAKEVTRTWDSYQNKGVDFRDPDGGGRNWRAIPPGRVAGLLHCSPAVAAQVSVLVAVVRLLEAYWAPMTTQVITTQSSLGPAFTVSWQRFMGTAPGAVVGCIAASHYEPHLLVFASGVFILGLLCAVRRAEQAACRFGGITMAMVMLVPRTGPDWQMALYRFAEGPTESGWRWS
jgi:hypothetical protein